MFWNTLGLEYLVEERQLEKKLNSPGVKLATVLEDMHCFQEIRNSNENVLNYLKGEQVFRELLEAVLCPQSSDAPFQKDNYKFAHQCCEALCLAARDFFKELVKHEDLLHKLISFLKLQTGNLNHLIVSFYSKLVISFLSAEPDTFLALLEDSDFLDSCFASLEFCAVFELLCSIANCLPDPIFRERVKKWYYNKGFADYLLALLSPDQPSEIHENVGAIWAEFIKALREIQYNVEVAPDILLDSLQSEEAVKKLLVGMFPADMCVSSSIVVNGSIVLNALLETNYIKNSPAWQISQEIQGNYNAAMDVSHGDGSSFVIDSHRMVESLCAEKSTNIVKIILHALEQPADAFCGDVLMSCMQLLVNMTNTNFLPTHMELFKTFASEETHLLKLFDAVLANPLRSIYNAQLTNLVLHILYSSTGSEKPLANFLIKDFNLPRVIRDSIDDNGDGDKRPLLEKISKKSFFLNLANRLTQCQSYGEHIDLLMKGLPDYDEWVQFNNRSVQAFVDQNRSDKVMSSTTRSSSNIEIDEIKDIKDCPFSMETSHSEQDHPFRTNRVEPVASISPTIYPTLHNTAVDNSDASKQEEDAPPNPAPNLSSDFTEEELDTLKSLSDSPTRKLFEALEVGRKNELETSTSTEQTP